MLFKSLLIGASLANIIVSSTPLPNTLAGETELYEREYNDFVPRGGDHFPEHGTYDKNGAVNFAKNIPTDKLTGGGDRGKQETIYSADKNGRAGRNGERQDSGHRLDYQGKTSDGKHNLQVQMNGKNPKGKTTVGGVITDGSLSANRLKKEITHSVMHPGRGKDGKDHLHEAPKKAKKSKK